MLTDKDSPSLLTSKKKSNKNKNTNSSSKKNQPNPNAQQRQQNGEAAIAAASTKEAKQLDDKVTALEEQITAKKCAAKDKRNQSNTLHKNLTQKRKREDSNHSREDNSKSVAQR